MNTLKRMLPVFVFVLAVSSVAGMAAAEDSATSAYDQYSQTVEPLQRAMVEKQAQLDALYAAQNPDEAAARQLFSEIAELEAQIFSAETALRATTGDDYVYAGRHHRGYDRSDDYGYGHRRGSRGGWGHGGYGRHGGRGYGHRGW
ncbi:MAG: hypothetical protein LUC93_07975 [Planctomycetaceae bacterium]|nr:hypothetical protein [Planctomycetaceae bacterium]